MYHDWLATVWLLVLVGVGSLYGSRLFLRSDYGAWESCLYLPTYLMGRLLWRVEFTNQAPEALRRGAILAANHRSSVDPFFVQLAARRRVHWMVAKEYCQHFAFGPLLAALQVIPTNRSGMDTGSTKSALRITQAGRLVGMFPEARINTSNRLLLPVRAGAALVAIRSQVPLIPLFIEGSPMGRAVWSPVFQPGRVRITFGAPLWPSLGSDDKFPEPSGDKFTDKLTADLASNFADRNLADHLVADVVESAGMGEKTPAKPNTQSPQLTESDALIVLWAKNIVALAGKPQFPVELASQRKRRTRS